MNVKDIRNLTRLSQVKFCKKYNIPRRTLEDWESGKSKPAEYLIELLEFKVRYDYGLHEKKIKCTYDGENIVFPEDSFIGYRDEDGFLVLPKEYDD